MNLDFRFFGLIVGLSAFVFAPHLARSEPTEIGKSDHIVDINKMVRPCKRCKPVRAKYAQTEPSGNSGKLASVAIQYLGSRKFTHYPGPWCRDGLNVWLRQAGYYTDGSRRAVDSIRLGHRISGPRAGALAVQRHHVSVVVDSVKAISANHGGRVAFHAIPLHAVFVMPRKGSG